jgi:hypothetical protein
MGAIYVWQAIIPPVSRAAADDTHHHVPSYTPPPTTSPPPDQDNFLAQKYQDILDYGAVLTDAGTVPTSEQPWGGMLINGVGRGTPYDMVTGNVIGPARGRYFQLRVRQGEWAPASLCVNEGMSWARRACVVRSRGGRDDCAAMIHRGLILSPRPGETWRLRLIGAAGEWGIRVKHCQPPDGRDLRQRLRLRQLPRRQLRC